MFKTIEYELKSGKGFPLLTYEREKIKKLDVNEIKDFDVHMCKIALQLLHESKKINLVV